MIAAAYAVAVAALAAIAALPTASAQTAAPSAEAPAGSVRATITDVGPPLTRDPGSVLRLHATFRNTSTVPATRVRWRLRVGSPVNTRVGLTDRFDERGAGRVLWRDDLQVIDSLPAGDRHDVALHLPVAALEDFPVSSGPAVYPLRFEVTHRLDTVIATADTFLIWFPQPQRTLRMGWLIPLTDSPAREGGSAVRGAALEKSVSTGGRLHRVLDALDRGEQIAGARMPVTLAINAELVESVMALRSRAGAAWLARLKQQAGRYPVLALPYADADLVALVRENLSAGLTSTLRQGRARLNAVLGITSIADIAWPAGEFSDAATTNLLAENGFRAVVLDRQSVRRTVDRFYTPTAASVLDAGGEQLLAVVPDAPVTSLAADMAAGGSRLPLTRQRLLAETAVIHQQRPSETRDVFVRFPRDWQPADPDATGELLALPLSAPWLIGTTLPAMLPPMAGARVSKSQYPQAARRRELAGSGLRAGFALRTELRDFQTILADNETPPTGAAAPSRDETRDALAAANGIRDQLERARDTLAWADSAHWRDREQGATALRASVSDMLNALRQQVVVQTNVVRLTTTSGELPITIENRLGTPVRVRLDLRSQRLGLSFDKAQDVTVAAARGTQPGTASVSVGFQAQTVGRYPVDAQLLTAENSGLGPPSRITVSTTAYGRLALLVTAGAFVLLVLASLARFVFRRRRGRGEPPPTEEPDPYPGFPPASVDAGTPLAPAAS